MEFLDGRDAEEAMNYLDGVNFGGREISVNPSPHPTTFDVTGDAVVPGGDV